MSSGKEDLFDMSNFDDSKMVLTSPIPTSGSTVNINALDPYGYLYNISSRAGWGYIGGFVVGTASGIISGIADAKKNPAIANNFNLYRNHLLNFAGRNASSLGNHCGTFGIVYSIARGFLTRKYPDNLKVADAFAVGAGCSVLHMYKGPITASALFAVGTVAGFGIFTAAEKLGLTAPPERKL